MIIDAVRDDHAAEIPAERRRAPGEDRALGRRPHEEAVAAMQRALEEMLK